MEKVLVLCLLLYIAVPLSAGAQSVGGGDLSFSPEGAGKVVFSHQVHVSIKGRKCSACHYHAFQMAKDGESFKMNMSKMTKGEFCGKCHNGERSFDVKDKKNCTKCHM